MSLPTAGPSVTGNSVLLPSAGAADHGPRYEQPGEEEPDETPPAVGHMDHDGGSDRDACQHGDRRRYEVPGRPPRPGPQGAAGRDLGSEPGGGKICQQIPQLTPGPRGQGPPRPLVELPGRQPARLEVLTQVRHDRITVGISSLHFSRKIIPGHGVHRAPAFPSRAVVSGFRIYLMSWTRVIAATAGCHQPEMTSVTVLPDGHEPSRWRQQRGARPGRMRVATRTWRAASRIHSTDTRALRSSFR
jgi:hypothetical protein